MRSTTSWRRCTIEGFSTASPAAEPAEHCSGRARGIDAWRDETGSSILGPMQGSVDEMMALAVEQSYTVIIFVSLPYKKSANCKVGVDLRR